MLITHALLAKQKKSPEFKLFLAWFESNRGSQKKPEMPSFRAFFVFGGADGRRQGIVSFIYLH